MNTRIRCVSVHVCNVHALVVNGWRLVLGIFSTALHLTIYFSFFETGSVTEPEVEILLHWLVSVLQGAVCLLSAGIIGMCCHTWTFYVGPREPLLGSHVCVKHLIDWVSPKSLTDHPDWNNSLLIGVPHLNSYYKQNGCTVVVSFEHGHHYNLVNNIN